MADIKVIWAGAQDNNEIQGYEISYKTETDTTFKIEPFITTNNSSGEYIIPEAVFGEIYTVRIRTKDMSGNFSQYRTTQVLFIDENPPTAPEIKLETTPNSIIVNWFGAFDATNIKGYEIEYKLLVEPTYTTEPFIATQETYGSYTITDLINLDSYEVRIRVQNVAGFFSDYVQATGTTLSAYTYLISSEFVPVTEEDKCDMIYPKDAVYSNVFTDRFKVGDKLFDNSELSIPFSGGSHFWKIGNLDLGFNSFQINNLGVVQEFVNCPSYVFEYNRSIDTLEYPLFEVSDGCTGLTLSNDYVVYTDREISELVVGNILYNDSSFTSKMVGYGRISKIGDYSMLISNDGIILEIAQCPIV